MKPYISGHSRQAGFNIIELLIASAIGMFISLGIMNIYILNKDTYRLQDSMSYVQRNSYLALDRLRWKIQKAGYSGFYPSFRNGVENILNTPGDAKWNIVTPIEGFDNVSANSTYAGITGFINGSDAVLLKSMTSPTNLKQDSTTGSLIINAGSGFSASDIILVTDQDQASIFQAVSTDNTTVSGQTTLTVVSTTTPQPGNSAVLSNTYTTASATVGKLETLMYYLKTGDNQRPALFEARLVTSSTQAPTMREKELISDVEGLQIVYGVDTDNNGSVNRYDTATTVTNSNQWAQVKSIGISMLLASDSANVAQDANSYSFSPGKFTYVRDTTPATDADKRLRRVVTTYINLKNG